MNHIGKYLIIGGAILMVIGAIVWLWGDKLGWIGKLPGDIRIEKENMKFYFPITTLILLSLALNLCIRIFNYFR
jgi:hypothetical protein